MTEDGTPARQRPPADDDGWSATLRRNREASELIRRRLAEETARLDTSRGIPCE